MRIANSEVACGSVNTFKSRTVQTQFSVAANAQKTEDKPVERPSYTGKGYKTIRSMAELKETLLEHLLEVLAKGRRMCYEKIADNKIALPPATQMIMVTTVESSYYYEEQATAFSSVGKVVTKDGREIEFSYSFEMLRSYEEENFNYGKQVYMCDPLIINFDGRSTELSTEKFSFDLDADGKAEEISKLCSNSGFLALDVNGDGKINDGSELFGTRSGDGFADLAKYDADHDGWIDEDDAIFDELKVWKEGKLFTLKEAGVGAICLTHSRTNFDLNNLYDNETNGAIRETGVFLFEDGRVGSVQHVDFSA